MERTAFDVANYFFSLSRKSNDPAGSARRYITNKKLQKLLYYAWAWQYTLNDELLFPEKVEAWIHGPAVPPVYGVYKQYSFLPIEPNLKNFSDSIFSDEEKDLMNEVWRIYGKYDADYLENLTHDELPWQEARNRGSERSFCDEEIKPEIAKQFYGDLQRKAKVARDEARRGSRSNAHSR